MPRQRTVIATLCLIFCIIAGSLPVIPAHAKEKPVYTLALIPNLPAVTLHKNWTPLIEYLERETGEQFDLKLYDKIESFVTEVNAGRVDFVYTSPNLFYTAHQRQKYVPLVRSADMIRGQLFVRKDSPYTCVEDLHGKTVAFVGSRTVCSILTRQALLKDIGESDYRVSFNGSSVNVAKSVLIGKTDAGAALDMTMVRELADMKNEFRTIMETEKVAPHPLAAHPRVPRTVQQKVTAKLLALNNQEQGRKILETIKMARPVKADFNRDYRLFSRYDLDRLDRQTSNQPPP